MKINASVKGDTAVIEHLKRIPVGVQTKVAQTIQRLTIMLQRSVIAGKLSGQVLKVRTGRLRRSVDQVVVRQGTSITGIVSTNVSYARAHEYGFNGTVNVKEHLRTITQAFGQPLKSPVTSTVHAHAMHMNIPEASFLRSALEDMTQQIRDELTAAAKAGAK